MSCWWKNEFGRSRAKILIFTIPVILLVIALIVALVVQPWKKEGTPGETAYNNEYLLKEYEDIKNSVDELTKEMADLESQQAITDPQTYAQEVEEMDAALEDLLNDVETASNAVIEAAEDVSNVSAEYAALYDELIAYYNYVEQMLVQAVLQIDYLKQIAPEFSKIHQLQQLVDRISKLPGVINTQQQRENSQQLNSLMEKIHSGVKAIHAPDSMKAYNEIYNSMTSQLNTIVQQIIASLNSGNSHNVNSLASQLNSVISSTFAKLDSQLDSMINSINAALSSLESAVSSPLPK